MASLTVLFLAILLSCSALLSSTAAKSVNFGEVSLNANTFDSYKPSTAAAWQSSNDVQKLKLFNKFSTFRRSLLPTDDESLTAVEKRYDDYGHMR